VTITEILPILKALNYKDKIRALQFLVNEVAKEEGIISEEKNNSELWSLPNSFEASQGLQKLLDEHKANAIK